MSTLAVLLAVFCACLLGPRLARLATACCLCELPLPLSPSAAHIPYHCRQPQAGRGALVPCLMCDRGAAALTEQHRTLAHSARRDAELGLPPTLPLPDGEEFPRSANTAHIRTPEQEEEIYQACIRPPPNRTVGSRELSPPIAAPAMCAGRFISNCAKSRPLRLDPRKSCEPTVIASELTVSVPTQRVDNAVASAPRPPERQTCARPPPNRPASERQAGAPVASSIAHPVAPPVTRAGRRLAAEVPLAGRSVAGRRSSGRLAARAAAAATGLFSRQRWQ